MTLWRVFLCFWLALPALAAGAAQPQVQAQPALVIALKVDGAISPASADYVVRGIAQANQRGAQAVLLELDTPGGLSSSMRDIIKAILNSAVPVIGY
ncbi:MAG: nodulation protein NfeD, partial [Proteobacteria bacterium]|nr:nodulation protein NfeD [Pseudomonadota bacterium]